MNCERCSGLMVQDRAYDLQDTDIHCDVWRCVCCGNMFDGMILAHQGTLRPRVHQAKKVRLSQELTAA